MTDPSRSTEGLTAVEKRELLGRLLAERSKTAATAPASFSQERMWLLHQLEPFGSRFNIQCSLRLRRELRKDALQQALDRLVVRHHSLRTVFAMDRNDLVQTVVAPAPVVLVHEDLSVAGNTEEERLDASRVARATERQLPFDLARGPLLRASLHTLGPNDHILVLTLHHIVTDGSSVRPLIMDLSTAYNAAVKGDNAPPPPLPIQYADFARWQRSAAHQASLVGELEYWRKQLAGTPESLDLPTDRAGSTGSIAIGDSKEAWLDADWVLRFKALARSMKATPYMVLLAGYQAWLQRMTGHDDVLVGTPVAGRTQPQTESLIGFFINMLVLRTDVSGNPTARELITRVRDVASAAFGHQEVPFEKLLEELKPPRRPGRTPLFQVYLNMLSFQMPRYDFVGLSVEPLPVTGLEPNFDLTLYAREDNGALCLMLSYRNDLFTASRATEMLAQIHGVLRAIVDDPDQPLSTVSLVTPASRPVLPDPSAPLSASTGSSLTDALEARPGSRHRDLFDRAGAIACRLVRAGLQTGDVVAIHAIRDAGVVDAILGILKAGGAFTILDSAYPDSRLAQSWNTAGARGLLRLTTTPLPAQLARAVEESKPHFDLVLPLESNGVADAPLPAELGAGSLAYVAFTSGTTGGVKAVAGNHGPLVHFLDWYARSFDVGPNDRFALLSGLSHDPLLRDVFAPLWLGASFCVPDPDGLIDPVGLTSWINKEGITVLHLTPALGEVISAAPDGTRLPSVRYAFFGGESLHGSLLSRFRSVAPEAVLVNFYGTTETPQAMAYHIVSADDSQRAGAVPLGRGIDDVQILVLNGSGGLAGVGELGEIHVRTRHLSRGYVGDAALTAQRFVRNPGTHDPTDIVYRTGDLGRYEPDGTVVFAGRRDGQVKLRGFRVELAEVEAALRTCPGVEEAAVVAHQPAGGGGQRLVAYFTSAVGSQPNVTQIRNWLRQSLPSYMVPSSFVALERLPLTPNGKLDRKALLGMGGGDPSRPPATPPRTPTEKHLARLWSDALGVPHVGVHDNFFDLGGHSLLAIGVLGRIEATTGVRLHPRDILFQNLEQLAKAVGEVSIVEPPATPVAADAEGADESAGGRLRSVLRGFLAGRPKETR